MLPFRIVSKFMRFVFVVDMEVAQDPRQCHCLCKRRHVNVVYHFAPMVGALHDLEYPAQPLEIMVLTLTMERKDRIVLDSLDRSIINRKMTILRVYDKKAIERIS